MRSILQGISDGHTRTLVVVDEGKSVRELLPTCCRSSTLHPEANFDLRISNAGVIAPVGLSPPSNVFGGVTGATMRVHRRDRLRDSIRRARASSVRARFLTSPR